MDEVAAAVRWIRDSGIQNTSGKNTGGFNGWYDTTTHSYPFVYSEITGYGITTLLYINEIINGNSGLNRAEMAADWIISRAMHKSGGVRARCYNFDPDGHYTFENNVLYVFDSGMVLFGLAKLFSYTGKESYLDAAKSVANFIIEMQKPNGLFYAHYDANNGERIDNQSKWSTQSGSYHAKIAMGLIDMYSLTGDEAYRNAAVDICNASIKFQTRNGNFVTQQNENSTHMHPHIYSAEGLAYAGIKLSNGKFMNASLNAVKWALDSQLPNGGVPCKYSDGIAIDHERSDTLAQVLRMATFFRSLGFLGGYDDKISRLFSRLVAFQETSGNQSGGFFYGTELDGTYRPHINSWCSMFALQAVHMFRSLGRGPVDLNLLV